MLAVGLLVGYLVIRVVKPPEWQHNLVLASTAFANAMGMPITLLDVIGHNFQPPGGVNSSLDPSMFQSIYVILNPVLQWGLGGWLLANDQEPGGNLSASDAKYVPHRFPKFPHLTHVPYSIPSLEDAGFTSVRNGNNATPFMRRNLYSIPSLEDAGMFADERTGLIIQTVETGQSTPPSDDYSISGDDDSLNQEPEPRSTPQQQGQNHLVEVLSKIASKALQPPALGALAGFVVASCAPLRGLFVDLQHRADNAPLEWIFDGVLTLARSAIPVNMCVVGVNLSMAAEQRESHLAVDNRTIAAVVLGKMLFMPFIGGVTVYLLKTYVWEIPENIAFQLELVLMMNFITPTANVVMVIAELGAGTAAKNVMASLIGYQYVVAPFLLSLTVMGVVWTAVL